MINQQVLFDSIKDCWSVDTSSDPVDWSIDNPAWGQCAVTSCVVCDFLGGQVIWAVAVCPDGREISHYFNLLPDKQTIDLTIEQFPCGTIIENRFRDFKVSIYDYILSFEKTKFRYEILCDRLKHKNF